MALALRRVSHPSVAIQDEISSDFAWAALSQVSEYERAALIRQLAQRGEAELAGCLEAIVACLAWGPLSEVKAAVCQAVRSAGPAGAAYGQEVAALLGDQDPTVKYEACAALASLGAGVRNAVLSRRLAGLLRHESEAVRHGACVALGGTGAEESAGQLAEALDDASPEVRGAACWALGRLGAAAGGSSDAVAGKLGDAACRARAVMALGTMGAERHCESVCDCLADADPEVRLGAAAAVGRMAAAVRRSAGAWDRVTDALRHPDGAVRCAAASAVGQMGAEGADQCGALLGMLQDDFEDAAASALTAGGCLARRPAACRKARCAAAEALGLVCASGAASVDVHGVAEEVARLLHEDSWEARTAACDAIGLMGARASNQAMKITTLFDDDMFAVRASAARACGRLGDASCTPALVDLLADKAPTVREAAVLALVDLGGDVGEFIGKVFEKTADAAPAVRAAAITALSRMGAKGELYASGVAQHLSPEEAPAVRVAALEALRRMGDRGAVFLEDLSQYLEDPMPQVRQAASKLLGVGEAAAKALEDERNETE